MQLEGYTKLYPLRHHCHKPTNTCSVSGGFPHSQLGRVVQVPRPLGSTSVVQHQTFEILKQFLDVSCLFCSHIEFHQDDMPIKSRIILSSFKLSARLLTWLKVGNGCPFSPETRSTEVTNACEASATFIREKKLGGPDLPRHCGFWSLQNWNSLVFKHIGK